MSPSFDRRGHVEEQQAFRLQILLALLDIGLGSQEVRVKTPCLLEALKMDMDHATFWQAFKYLADEGLVAGHNAIEETFLTHKGLVETEKTITAPGKDTEHFLGSVTNIIFQGNANGIAVAVGGQGNTLTATYAGGEPVSLAEVLAAIRAAAADDSTPEGDRQVLASSAEVVERAGEPTSPEQASRMKRVLDLVNSTLDAVEKSPRAVAATKLIAVYLGFLAASFGLK